MQPPQPAKLQRTARLKKFGDYPISRLRILLVGLFTAIAVACGPGESDSSDKDPDELRQPDNHDTGWPSPFATRVISFEPGENAGFGQNKMPEVVLGPPQGRGDRSGSLDVLSLGREGEIVLAFDEQHMVDGPGPDLLVFENPFSNFIETGIVGVSDDLETWHEWPCDPLDEEGGYPGCAGVNPVYAHPDNDLDPTDPEQAGGDAFDLADLGISRARYLRIRDTGLNEYDGNSGGFDLDAVAIVNGVPVDEVDSVD